MYPPHSLVLKTAPGVEPLTRAQCYLQERLTPTGSPLSHPEDDLIDLYIKGARQWAELQTRRALITQIFTMKTDGFPSSGFIEIPKLNLQSVASVKYFDENGDLQTWSTTLYEVDTDSDPGRIQPVDGETYPTTNPQLAAVEIEFTAGYGDASSDIDQTIILAMLMTFGHLYQNREAVVVGTIAIEVPLGAKVMLAPFKDRTETFDEL